MRIALVGSWKDENANSANFSLVDKERFFASCRTLGGEIARHGHSLIVGSESERTADFHAVVGVVDAFGHSRSGHPRIIVLRRNDQKTVFDKWRNEYAELFSSRHSPDPGWTATHLFQLKESDSLIVIGGGTAAYHAGLAAALCGKRLVPIGSFGGAGRRLNELLSLSWATWHSKIPTIEELGRLNEPWTNVLMEQVIRLAGGGGSPQLMIVHGRSDDRWKLKNYLQNTLHLPEPTIMNEGFHAGEVLPDKFEFLAKSVDAAIALVTPDDVGALAQSATEITEFEKRARQNVWLEVGWFWGRLGRRRFLLLCKDQTVIPSDLHGVEYLRYQDHPAERGDELRSFVDDLRGA